jgi:phenylalanine-4-hydroxylase
MQKPASARSSVALRGDYAHADAAWRVPQDWHAYTPEMHDRWRRLYVRQRMLAEKHAARSVVEGLERLGCADAIPDFGQINQLLGDATGWQLASVPGFIPDDVFFAHLAARRFPVTRWLREEIELDYLVEPDVFHDFFGHVPLLLDPGFGDFLQAYGRAGARAMAMDALPMLARIYWYTVEFGLIEESGALRAYGAGLVSSAGELVHATTSPGVLRLPFDPVRIMRTDYSIDAFQRCYFVISGIDGLMNGLSDLDFGPVYETWRDAPPIAAGERLPGEPVWPAPQPKGRDHA